MTDISQPQSRTLQATPAFCFLLQPSPPQRQGARSATAFSSDLASPLTLLPPSSYSSLLFPASHPLVLLMLPPSTPHAAPPPGRVRLFVTAGGPSHRRTSSSPRGRTSLAASHTPKRSHSHSPVPAHLPAARGEAKSRKKGVGTVGAAHRWTRRSGSSRLHPR